MATTGHYVARQTGDQRWHQFDTTASRRLRPTSPGDKKKKPPRSSESYMLAYVRRRWFEERQGTTQPPPKKRRGARQPARQPAAQPAAPPESAKNHVENLDAEHAAEKVDWSEGKEALEASVRRRREAYERLFGGVNTATPARTSSDDVVPEFNGDVALLETDALEAWVAASSPGRGRADENAGVNMAEDSTTTTPRLWSMRAASSGRTPTPARCRRDRRCRG